MQAKKAAAVKYTLRKKRERKRERKEKRKKRERKEKEVNSLGCRA